MNDLKLGTVIALNDQPYVVTYTQHIKMARASATLRTKLKNLITGSMLEKSFSGGDKIEEANISRRGSNFLYTQGDTCFFMDNETFEHYEIPTSTLGDRVRFLKDGQTVDILLFNDHAMQAELPKKITLTVDSAPPGVRGDTSGTATKTVTLETGLEIRVPLFIKTGDEIRINTGTGDYVERV